MADADTIVKHLCGDHGLCPACPSVVRDLSANAHNTHLAVEAALSGAGDWSRARRKLADLGESLARFQAVLDHHFADHGYGCTEECE